MMKISTLAVVAVLAAGPAWAQTEPEPAPEATAEMEAAAAEMGATATASLVGADGADHGTATLTQTNSGVLVQAELTGVPAGEHGFHFHETGVCEPPFESAGGHYNPTDMEHGFMAEGGPHAGDMPNIHVPDSGELTVNVLNTFVSLEADAEATLFDDDGTALMIHANPDDHESQPSGDAGDRIACGVVEQQ